MRREIREMRPAPRSTPLLLALVGSLVGLLGLAGAGCTIERRSDAYVCRETPDCSDGRICVNQLCVLGPDAGPIDGAPATCPASCTRCENGTCVLDCSTKDCENFTCPTGWKCRISCGARRCQDIDCGSSECDITCTGANACEDVRCGPKRCNISCVDRNSCEMVDCASSCSCTLTCSAAFGCLGADLSCPTGCAQGAGGVNGCDGTSATCNRCSM